MDTVFDKYLGYETKEKQNEIVQFLRSKRFAYFFINNELPYNFLVE